MTHSIFPTLLASYPAQWIDSLEQASPRAWQKRDVQLLATQGIARVVNATIFPIFLSIDIAHHSARYIFYRWLDKKTVYGAKIQAQHHADAVMMCLWGLAACPFGLIWADVASSHFLRPKVPIHNQVAPLGGLYRSNAWTFRPSRAKEVQTLVKQAGERGKKVSIEGAGLSQGKHILPPSSNDYHLDMKGINRVAIDPIEKTATVGGGALWRHVQNAADRHGLAVQVQQASNIFSVGGSLSANCHGWDHRVGSLANTVQSITIVNAKGELQTLTPKDELFRYVVGGYGMFGVIAEVTIKLVDNSTLKGEMHPMPFDAYNKYFQEQVKPSSEFHMHRMRLSVNPGQLLRTGWIQNYTPTGTSGASTALVDEPQTGTRIDRILLHVARRSWLARRMLWKKHEHEAWNPHVGTRNEIMRPNINALFANRSRARQEWLQEYFFPCEKFEEFTHFLGDILNKHNVKVLNATVRYVKRDTHCAMSYAHSNNCFAIVLCFSQSLNPDEVARTKAWVQEVVDGLLKVGGSFYLPYQHFATREQFHKSYPQWQTVLKKKLEYDPKEIFDNGFYRDYLKA